MQSPPATRLKRGRIERGGAEGLTVDERARLVHLERENAELRKGA